MQRKLWFLVDAQLSPRVAKQLTAAGYPSAPIVELLGATATDLEIAALANELGAVVMSKDEDFLDLLDRRRLLTGLVWVRIGNTDAQRQWSAIEPVLHRLVERFEAGESLVEIPFYD
ncbi:MAG: DUF5615 family PIN-like protein [Devosia sp.]|nr:DUF5615 family PIN-like protein [Devosia sp.]